MLLYVCGAIFSIYFLNYAGDEEPSNNAQSKGQNEEGLQVLEKEGKNVDFFSLVKQIGADPNETGFAEGFVIIPPFFYQCLVGLVPVLQGKRQSSGSVPLLQALPALLDNVHRLQHWGNWD